jgi:hypothetical protein
MSIPKTGDVVPREDIARGYEVGKGQCLIVEDDDVLTDEQDKPIGGEGTKRFIGPDGHHRIVACLMLRQRTRSTAKSSSFHRPLHYLKLYY